MSLIDQDKKEGSESRARLWVIETQRKHKSINQFLELKFRDCKKIYAVFDVKLNADGSILVAVVEHESEAGNSEWSIRVFVKDEGNKFSESFSPQFICRRGAEIPLSKLRCPRLISLSSDGNTLAVSFNGLGGYGAVVIFNRVIDKWIPIDDVLTHELCESIDDGEFGSRMALSGDGQTLVVGAPLLSNPRPVSGGIIIFRRNYQGKWLQDGPIILPDNAVGLSHVGDAVGIDANGDTIVFSGAEDTDPRFEGGAAWVYQRQSALETE